MSSGEPNSKAPLVTQTAPQIRLVPQAKTGPSEPILCRRVVTLIGSRSGCKIVLDSKRVSPVHTAIVHTGTGVYAIDLLTKTGTTLNSLPLEHELLSDGDVLEIGGLRLLTKVVAPQRVGLGDVHTLDLEPTPQVIALEHVGTRRLLQPTREVCIVGRREGCDIAVSDPSVSRVHALLFKYHGFPAVVDLLSRNGIQVNGEQVTFRVLKDGDMLTIGSVEFCVRLAMPGGSSRGQSKNGSGSAAQPSPATVSSDDSAPLDLIDIHATESAERWAIVDHMAKRPVRSY